MNEWKALYTIARWEFVQRIRTPMLIILLIASPLITILSAFAPLSSGGSAAKSERQIIVGMMNGGENLRELQRSVAQSIHLLDGSPKYVFVPALAGDEDAYYTVLLHSRGAPTYDIDILKADGDFSEEALLIARTLADIEKGMQGHLPQIYDLRDATPRSTSGAMNLLLSVLSLHLLTLTLVSGSGQLLIRSMFEEKQTRLFDVMISSSSPRAFLLGKFLGVLTFGLVQAGVWILIAFIAAHYSGFGDISRHLPLIALSAIVSFILFSALYLLIAATVENDSSAQAATYFTTIAALLPLSLMVQSFSSQSGIVDTVAWIPLFAPNIASMKMITGMHSPISLTMAVILALTCSAILLRLSLQLFERRIRHGVQTKKNNASHQSQSISVE